MDDLQGPNGGEASDSLLPYEVWTEEAFRSVAVRALEHAATHGLPGEHHFYITFRSDHPATSMPTRLRAKYPEEMTIVLQPKYWDLTVDEGARFFSVGLSFSGQPSTLVVPFDALTGFADPSVKWGLRFRPVMPEAPATPARTGPRAIDREDEDASPGQATTAEPLTSDTEPQVVSLDAFRKRKD